MLFQALLCQSLVPQVLRLVLKGVTSFEEYSLWFEKDAEFERCFIVCGVNDVLKKICIGREPLEQCVPRSHLVPLSHLLHCLPIKRLPLSLLDASASLMRVLEDNLDDGRRFIVYRGFDEVMFLLCIRLAHQVVFGMVEVTGLVDYTILRLKSSIYEAWTEDRVLLRKCIRQGFVAFKDLREVLTDLIDLWPTIRPYVRCTGLPDVKGKADSVSALLLLTVSIGFFFSS